MLTNAGAPKRFCASPSQRGMRPSASAQRPGGRGSLGQSPSGWEGRPATRRDASSGRGSSQAADPLPAHWSAEELKNSLFESLRKSGTVESLKAQLRAQVVDKLQGENGDLLKRQAHQNRLQDGSGPEDELEEHILQSLVADYLESRGCMYTLSVFVPEDGLGDRIPLSRAELSRILHYEESRRSSSSDDEGQDENSRGEGNLSQNAQSHLKTQVERIPLLKEVLGRQGDIYLPMLSRRPAPQTTRCKDSGTQTADGERFDGDTAISVLDRKLNRINERYALQLERESLAPRRSEEERMIRYQRDCDKRAEEHIRRELKRFQESELAAMRMQERALMRKEIGRERDSMRKELQGRLAQISERERALEEAMRREHADMEAALFEERQKLLQRFATSDAKSSQERRELEIERKALKQSEKNLEKMRAELEQRLLELRTLELDLKRKYEDEIRTYRQSVLSDYQEREQRVQREELSIREEQAALSRAKSMHASEVQAASTVFADLEKAKKDLLEMTHARDDALVRARALDDQLVFMKETAKSERERHDRVHTASIEQARDFEALRSRMELIEGADVLKEKQRLIDELRGQIHESREESAARIRKLENENAVLVRDKDRLEANLHEALAQVEGRHLQHTADLNDALLEAREELERYRTRAETAQSSVRALETENADLRRLLSQARHALDEEIANPKPYNEPAPKTPPLAPMPAPPSSVPPPSMTMSMPMAMPSYSPFHMPFLPYNTAASSASSDVALQLAKLQEYLAEIKNQTPQKGGASGFKEPSAGEDTTAVEKVSMDVERSSRSDLAKVNADGVHKKPVSLEEAETMSPPSGNSDIALSKMPVVDPASKPSASDPLVLLQIDSNRREATLTASSLSPKTDSMSHASSNARVPRDMSKRREQNSPGTTESRLESSSTSSSSSSPLHVDTAFRSNSANVSGRSLAESSRSNTGRKNSASSSPQIVQPRASLNSNSAKSPPSSRSSRSIQRQPGSPLRISDLRNDTPHQQPRTPLVVLPSPAKSFASEASEDQAQVVDLSEEDAIRAIRETQERQRKLQEERERERVRRMEETQRRLADEVKRREDSKEAAKERAAAEAKAREDAEREAKEAEMRAKQRENDSIIEQYRQKAKAKLEEQNALAAAENEESDQGSEGSGDKKDSTTGASASVGLTARAGVLSPVTPHSSLLSESDIDDEISVPSQSGAGTGSSSEDFGF